MHDVVLSSSFCAAAAAVEVLSVSYEWWEMMKLGFGEFNVFLLLPKTTLPDGGAEDDDGDGAEEDEHGDFVLLVEAVRRDVGRGGGAVVGQGGGVFLAGVSKAVCARCRGG